MISYFSTDMFRSSAASSKLADQAENLKYYDGSCIFTKLGSKAKFFFPPTIYYPDEKVLSWKNLTPNPSAE